MDETGADGFPSYSSQLFVLSSIYFHHQDWHSNYYKLERQRRVLRDLYGFKKKHEFHTRAFMFNKSPYRNYNWSEEEMMDILERLVSNLCEINFKSVNVVIDKTKIKKREYGVLENALTYCVQRIENDLIEDDKNKYLIITDEGRIAPMRKITRKMQKINYIPSKYGYYSYRREIKGLIEDPLPKRSDQSLFIQMVDLISYLVFLYMSETWGSRINSLLTQGKVKEYLRKLKDSNKLNLAASTDDEFGIVCYPK